MKFQEAKWSFLSVFGIYDPEISVFGIYDPKLLAFPLHISFF
jgi:hypothetical protein